MKPFSSTLFDGVLARGHVAAAVGDDAWLTAMLQVEAALAQVQAFSGLIPQADADTIADCARPDRFDPADLGARAAAGGDPVGPLVETLRALAGPAGASVHLGATGQDILDTAGMLIASQALRPLLGDLAACAEHAARLAREHRDTRMPGRTMLRRAAPTTFGLKAAGWLSGLDAARWRLEQVRRERLAVQFGGAAGTLAPFGEDGPDVVEGLATLLGLAEPVLPWHTERTRIAELAGALGAAAGTVAKVARDLTLLAQNEVGEVGSTGAPSSGGPRSDDPGSGGPGSGGPGSGGPGSGGPGSGGPGSGGPGGGGPGGQIAAVCAAGSAASAPGLVANLLAAMPHEHERAAGAWHAEWRPLRELFLCTGSAASWLRTALDRLLVHPDVMRTNLAREPQATELPDAAGTLVDRALRMHAKGR